MPREFTLTSTEPIDAEVLIDVVGHLEPVLTLRPLFGGWAAQVLDAEGTAVLTIEGSRWVEATVAPLASGWPDRPVWLTEATAPWGSAGDRGSLVISAIAAAVDADLIKEEGT
ncbi:hypothetical protein ACQBAR_11505 [Propionibacteriaceae bacterium Y1685]